MVGPLEAGCVVLGQVWGSGWGRGRGARGPACSFLSLPGPAPLVCPAVLRLLCCCLNVLSSVSFPRLPAPAPLDLWVPLSVCVSVWQAGSLCSFAIAAKGLRCLTAHLQLPGSANSLLGLCRGTGRSCSRTMGRRVPARLSAHGARRTCPPPPGAQDPGGPGRLASPVLRKPSGPTR